MRRRLVGPQRQGRRHLMKYKGEMDLSYQDMGWLCIAVGATPLNTMLGPVNLRKLESSLQQAIAVHQHHMSFKLKIRLM
jgi:hypothetical protein